YAAAETGFSTLSDKLPVPSYGSPSIPLVSKSAKIAHMETKWAHAQFVYADAESNKLVADKPAERKAADDRRLEADKLRDEAKTMLVNDIGAEEAPAYLPAELAEAIGRKPIVPTTQSTAVAAGPSTAPTTEPTTNPA